MSIVAYAWRTGLIEIGDRTPDGALALATGTFVNLCDAVQGSARLAYDNASWLVPGVPEAPDDRAALDALFAYTRRLRCSLRHVQGRRRAL